MKKYLPLLAAALALTACTASPAETAAPAATPPAESVTAETAQMNAFPVGTLRSPREADDAEAFYSLYSDSETHKYQMLRIDYAKAEQEKMCEVGHESAYSCFTANGTVVVVWSDSDQYGFTVISRDGTTQDKPMDREFKVDVYEENAAYELTSKSCFRLDLQSGEITRTEAPLTQLCAVYGIVDNKVLISRYVTDTPLPDPNDMGYAEMYQAIIQNSMIEFDLYDIATNTIQKLFDWEYGSNEAGSAQYIGSRGSVAYFTMSQWDGNESPPITNALRGFDTATGTWQEVHAESAVLNCGTGTLAFYKLADGTTYEVPYRDTSYGDSSNGGFPISLTGDGRILVTDGTVTNRDKDIGYGLIDLDAYLSGSTDYTPVQMWQDE